MPRRISAPLTPEQQALAAGQVGMARDLARIASRRCPRLRPLLESDAMLAVVEAAGTYRADGGCSFKTYAFRAIRWRMARVGRIDRPRGFRRRTGAPRVRGIGDCPEDMLPPATGEPVGWEIESADEFDRLLRPLEGRSREMVLLRYAGDETQQAIGDRFGMTRERARQIVGDALETLRLHETARAAP